MTKDHEEMNQAMQRQRDPGFWREMWQQARLAWRLLRDRDVPIYLKALPFLSLVYWISPVDLLPGIVLDDITAVLVGLKVFIELAPPHVVARHMDAIRRQDQMMSDDPAGDDVGEAIIIDHDKIVDHDS